MFRSKAMHRFDAKPSLLPLFRWRIAIATTSALVGWMLAASVACAQYAEYSGSIKTKDTGLGALGVDYFLESSGADSEGLLHVEVTTLKTPAIADRSLEVVFFTDSVGWGANSDLAIHFTVELAEGASQVRAAVPFFLFSGAQYAPGQGNNVNWDIGIFENGRDIEESRIVQSSNTTSALSRATARGGTSLPFHTAQRTQSYSATLHIIDDNSLADSEQAIRVWLAQEQGVIGNVLTATTLMEQPFDLTRDSLRVACFRPVSSLPSAWQYYLQFRLLVIHRATFERLCKEQSQVAAAIKRYIASGGNLLLLGDKESDCQSLVDSWLDGRQNKTDQPKLNQTNDPNGKANPRTVVWSSVRQSMDEWWLRDPTGRPRSLETAGSRSGRSNAVLATDANLAMISKLLMVNASYVPQPLNKAGVMRDGFTMWKTFWEAKYGGFRRSLLDLYRLFLDEVNAAENNPALAIGGAMVVEPEATETNIGLEGTGAPMAYPMISLDLEWLLPYVWQSTEEAIAALERRETKAVGVRGYLLGRVGYLQPELARFPQETLTAIHNELAPSVSVGVHTMQDQLWTFRNLIDSVGRPPVWTFCAIVLAFGMLLGPGLLFFTAWMRRRSLMIFLVPFCSLVATVAIVAYETLHDGFSTHARVTAVMAIDGNDGTGFVWSRQTYFSGRPPREGFKFPNDVYFRPVDAETSLLGRAYRRRRSDDSPRDAARSHIYVSDQETRWVGALQPREQQQFLIGNAVQVSPPIRINRIDGESITIENLTEENLPFVLVRDAYDGYYLNENIAPGTKAETIRSLAEDLGGSLSRVRALYILDVPDGVRQLGRWAGVGDKSTSNEVIDRVWFNCLNEDASAPKLPPFGYLTLLSRSNAAYKPIAPDQEQSQYLVIGRTQW